MTQDKLDQKIERLVKKYVKHYYTDWKNYDRPKYMKLKGEKPESILLILRSCGTYIFSDKEIETIESCKAIYEYFTTHEPSNIYKINMKKGSIKLIHSAL